jgi:uncharacterized protein (TIGR02268 family)
LAQPTTLVFALVLILGTTARAQPSTPREQRQRSITVTGNPAERPHEIHVAKGVATLLRFKSQINRDAVEVEGRGTRITVDAGDSSIILEPLSGLGSAELVLSVPFANGQRAVFILVSRPDDVDTRIDVALREQTIEACQAELTAAQERCSKISPVHFARAGWLRREGLITRQIRQCEGPTRATSGLSCAGGTTHRAETWVLVDVTINNESNEHPWEPSEVTIKGMKSRVPLTVRAVEVAPARIAPGERGRVFVEVEPPINAGEQFVLELSDAERGITIPEMDLSMQEDVR